MHTIPKKKKTNQADFGIPVALWAVNYVAAHANVT